MTVHAVSTMLAHSNTSSTASSISTKQPASSSAQATEGGSGSANAWPQSLILWLCGLGFAGFGLAFLIAPQAMAVWVGLAGVSSAGALEITAFYGGLELGLGLYLCLAATLRDWHRSALALAALAFGTLGIVRGVLMVQQDLHNTMLISSLGTELVLAAMACYGFLRSRK